MCPSLGYVIANAIIAIAAIAAVTYLRKDSDR